MRRLTFALLGLAMACGSSTVDDLPLDAGVSADAGTVRDAGSATGYACPTIPTIANDWTDVPSGASTRLQTELDRGVLEMGLIGVGMAVIHDASRQVWVGTSGRLDPSSPNTWDLDRQFRIGSVTKTFTIALLLQLVGQGIVSLDDPLERWVPGYYDGLGVTVRHVATNTSGIASYNYVGSFDDSKPWTPTQLVEWAVLHEPALQFTPGSEWVYSNTNFVLIGLIVEAATGWTYETLVQRCLLDPVQLDDTYVAGSGDTNPRVVPSWHPDGTDLTNAADPSFGWAAGAIVSTPRDLARWAAALYGGNVLTDKMRTLMLTPSIRTVDEIDYGMGVFIESDATNAIYGHTGGIAGYNTYVYYARNQRTAVVVMSNLRGTNLRELSGYGWAVAIDP